MKMSRYINADTVFNELTNRYKTAKGEARKTYREALDIVTAVEDIEVRHGRWIYLSGLDIFECSVCGRQMARNIFEYCPWCGAKMDEVEE